MTGPVKLTADSEAAGERLDSFLARRLPELTRSAAARLIAGEQVTVNGSTTDKGCTHTAALRYSYRPSYSRHEGIHTFSPG